jgi:hypothetical protein
LPLEPGKEELSMRTTGALVAGLIVAAASAVALPAPAGAQLSKAGVVTASLGSVTVARASAAEPSPLAFKDDVYVHDRITTGDRSTARMLLGGRAVVTARERSVLVLTETLLTSTLGVSSGRVALAVVKERMQPGEVIEIRTPNAVAGVRGTVVIVEVFRATAQAGGGPAAFTSRFTVLKGVVDVTTLDPTGRPFGPPVVLNRLQTSFVTGTTAPRPPRDVSPAEGQQLAAEFQVGPPRPSGNDPGVVASQVERAQTVATDLPAPGRPDVLVPRTLGTAPRAPILPGGASAIQPPAPPRPPASCEH